jgi:hypothetical protein
MLLGAHGFPVVPHRVCQSADDARKAAAAFGGCVVVKGCSSAVPHKTEHGLVVLDVANPDQAAGAFALLTSRMRALGVEGTVLVCPKLSGASKSSSALVWTPLSVPWSGSPGGIGVGAAGSAQRGQTRNGIVTITTDKSEARTGKALAIHKSHVRTQRLSSEV